MMGKQTEGGGCVSRQKVEGEKEVRKRMMDKQTEGGECVSRQKVESEKGDRRSRMIKGGKVNGEKGGRELSVRKKREV